MPKTKPEPKKVPGYVHCSTCDIYYPEKFLRDAEAWRDKMLAKAKHSYERMMANDIIPCPMCKAKMRESISSLANVSDCSRYDDMRRFNDIMSRSRQSGKQPTGFIRFVKAKK